VGLSAGFAPYAVWALVGWGKRQLTAAAKIPLKSERKERADFMGKRDVRVVE